MLILSRALIQQLYLQVCNIGNDVKSEVNKSQGDLLTHLTRYVTTVETKLETFTRRQTVLIEKWRKVDDKIREEVKDRETWNSFMKELQELIAEIKGRKQRQIIIFDENFSSIKLDQIEITQTRLLISRMKKLTENNMSKRDALSTDQRKEFDRLHETAKMCLEDLQVNRSEDNLSTQNIYFRLRFLTLIGHVTKEIPSLLVLT